MVKNKVAPPFPRNVSTSSNGTGISREGEIIDLGVEHKIVDKSGAWYAYGGNKIGQGKDNTREFLRANPDLAREIENKVRAAVSLPGMAVLAANSQPQPKPEAGSRGWPVPRFGNEPFACLRCANIRAAKSLPALAAHATKTIVETLLERLIELDLLSDARFRAGLCAPCEPLRGEVQMRRALHAGAFPEASRR